MTIHRVLPITRGRAGGAEVDDAIPRAALQSVTMAIRLGKGHAYAIGYVQELNWTMEREHKVLHQIEPFPNGTFGAGSFDNAFLDASYWPGEPVEIVPGKMGGVKLTLKRYALYSSNLLASVFRAQEASEPTVPIGTQGEELPKNDPINLNGTVANNYVSLIQQVRPVDIYQIYYSPYSGDAIFGRKFEECWFTSLGEDAGNAESNNPVMDNGELIATRVRPYNNIG